MGQIPDSPAGLPMSLRKYAKRRGVSAMAVSNAVKHGRLVASVTRDENGDPKIADPDLADREWEANTSAEHRERAAGYAPTPARVSLGDEPTNPGVAAPSAKEGMSRADAAAVQMVWKAKQAELDYRHAAGELVEVRKVEHRLTDVFTTCRTRLLGLPSRARQSLPHLTPADIATLESLVREALEELAAGAQS